MEKKKVVLIIMDGWGEAPAGNSNAISCANTPFINSLYKNYPHSHLLTSGENVGLPEGQMGNSEVGHLNIGAGRIVYQELALINKAVRENTIAKNKTLLDTFDYVKKNNCKLHFIGLVSDGGVHSHTNHLIKLCQLANDHGLGKVFIHAFTDGRDTDPKSGIRFIRRLIDETKNTSAKIASVIGRYYAMDRDKRWERIKLAYDLLVNGMGKHSKDLLNDIEESYNENVTDEFIKPIVKVDENDKPVALVENGDAVICFNFRTDRCREISTVLTQHDMPEHGMKTLNLFYVTMSRYDDKFQDVHVMYEKDNLKMTLGEVLSEAGKKQLRIAETEKYPHVTFFFSGGREDAFDGEKRIMIPSPKVATYDLKPSMSAYEVKEALVNELKKEEPDFVCINFANADMVGHTGVFAAAIEALETVDKCVKEIVETGLQHGYSFLITADHGNADMMVNPDGTPNTAHTTNPVPLFYADKNLVAQKISDGILSDLAPTILSLMKIETPSEMAGKNLLKS
ncbi:MAG TPA: 2,3-bisphosphoglycerate-independent phosphoglycerate mutase [Bacteroidia bacterium]|nr:2,3-bisphosphoglycerate-independent phosphoglycerate mutase [Bacteroidia bacterium]